MTEDDKKQTADAQYAAFDALARVHAWRWERMGAMAEMQEAMAALEQLRLALEKKREEQESTAEGEEWDPLACQWVQKEPKTGPAIRPRATGA